MGSALDNGHFSSNQGMQRTRLTAAPLMPDVRRRQDDFQDHLAQWVKSQEVKGHERSECDWQYPLD